MPIEILHTGAAGRGKGRLTLRGLLGEDGGETAVHLLGRLLRPGLHALQGCGAHRQDRSGHKRPPARRPIVVGCDVFPPRILVLQGAELALLDAVEAVYATGVINLLRILADGDAMGLAVQFAGLAVLALFGVNHRAEGRKAGEEAERGAHRADSVAVAAAALEGDRHDDHQSHDGHHEGGQAAQPHFLLIEGVTAGFFGPCGQQVVAP